MDTSWNVLQNVIFPAIPGDAAAQLYYYANDHRSLANLTFNRIRPAKDETDKTPPTGGLQDPADFRHEHLSFYTYFNALSVDRWKAYAGVESVRLYLRGHGRARITLYAHSYGDTLITVDEYLADLGEGFVSRPIDLSTLSGILAFDVMFIPEQTADGFAEAARHRDDGRGLPPYDMSPERLAAQKRYWSMLTLHTQGRVDEGFFCTDAPARREADLSMIVTTYKREHYMRKLVRMFREEALHRIDGTGSRVRLMLVDNGNTLAGDEFAGDENVRVLPNPNTGGAGGFSRGMLEALENPDCTHLLLMDDDVVVLPESVRRSVYLLRNLVDADSACVGGAMLDMNRPWVMHEQGAGVANCRIVPNKANMDLRDPSQLWRCFEMEHIDYNGWWFFLMPREACEKVGLALPLFFRGDDINYCFRLAKAGYSFLDLNGICIWHESFCYKDNPAQVYYDMRNQLLMVMGRDPSRFRPVSAARVRSVFWRRFTLSMALHRYRRAERLMEGVHDFLKGPDFLKSVDEDALNQEMMRDPEEKIVPFTGGEFDAHRFEISKRRRVRWYHRLLYRLTLNGLLWPAFLCRSVTSTRLNKDPGVVYQTLPSVVFPVPARAFMARRIVYVDRNAMRGFTVTVERLRGLRLWWRGIRTMLALRFGYDRARAAYDRADAEITSPDFWRARLGR